MPRSKAVPVEGKFVYRYTQVNYAPPVDEFDNPIGTGSIDVRLNKYAVLSQTPKGLWIDGPEGRKFISTVSRKQFACLSKEDAIISFISRKKRHISILEAQLKSARVALTIASACKEKLTA